MSTITREWFPPETGEACPLMLYNSLNDEKVPFVPAKGIGSKSITWYTCGPTVYDSAHMGHARNYVTFDILRRILEDYFGYNCMFIMNVTDVDDKIIKRARRKYLLNGYKEEGNDLNQVLADAEKAISTVLAKQQSKLDKISQKIEEAESEASGAASKGSAQKKVEELKGMRDQEQLKVTKDTQALEDLKKLKANEEGDVSLEAVLSVAEDYIAEILDEQKGSTVTDQSVFRELAAKYEAEFMEDMEQLGCRPPDALTRVSEYMEETINYVKGIVEAGFGYESNGSVYFDSQEYRAKGHVYGKLNPWAVGSAALAAEGEANFETTEKKSPSDFALWKASKPGEPFWESPWGKGRPGWHIECSAMASTIAGSKLDIHTGGEDLRFPHHDNELAQAEAYYHCEGCRQWVNYFLHSGHLNIEGLKMSKSLKNFITIREALKTFSARQLRLMFVLQPWNKPMVYGEQSREEMKSKEMMLKNFFQNVDVATRDADITARNMRWEEDDFELQNQLSECQKEVHESLSDNINTRGAMDAMGELIKGVNIYLSKREAAKKTGHPFLLQRIAGYVTKILSVFGLVDYPCDQPGFGGSGGSESKNMGKYLDTFAAFRDEIRALARGKADLKDILAACDRVRDETLVELGVRLEDKPDGKAVWKLDDPNVLRAEIEDRKLQAALAKTKKLKNKLELKLKEKERFEKGMAPPEKYSQFDETTGDPTHDKEGKALEGKALDNARKDMDKIRKRRAPLEKKLKEDPNYLENLEAEIKQMQLEISQLE